jgi:hypothetical protein
MFCRGVAESAAAQRREMRAAICVGCTQTRKRFAPDRTA